MAQAKLIADVVQDLSGIFVVCEKGASSSAEAQAVLQVMLPPSEASPRFASVSRTRSLTGFPGIRTYA